MSDCLLVERLKEYLKLCVVDFFYRRGFELKKIESPMKLKTKKNPRLANYFERQICMEVDISEVREFNFFPFSDPCYHPFVVALMFSDKTAEGIAKIIHKYYNSLKFTKPKRIWNHLNDEEFFTINSKINLPWSANLINLKDSKLERFYGKENLFFLGPTSPESVMDHAERLLKIFHSMRDNGYLRNNSQDGDASSIVLYKNQSEWRFLLGRGRHRVPVAKALGYEKIPIRFKKIIYRDDVDVWPLVQSGYYTKKEALFIFDSIFDGKLPSVFDNWVKYVNKERLTHK